MKYTEVEVGMLHHNSPIDALDSLSTLSFLFSPVSPALSAPDMVEGQKTQWSAFLATIRGFCDCSKFTK